MPQKFILEIDLGNEGAQTGYDVAHMLRVVAFVISVQEVTE